jgi:hypothetical protein
MSWLAWRQFRSQALLAMVLLAIVVAALVATRHHVVASYSPTGTGQLTGAYVWLRLLGTALIGVPAMIGAFWGAPLIAGELEAETHRLAWTQSITRARWLGIKLAIIAIVVVAVSAGFSIAFTWWSGPIDATGNRIGTANFGQRGIVPIGYALFALALGTLVGMIVRRTLPAMAATLVGFFAVRLLVQQFVRVHLVAAVELRTETFAARRVGGWVLGSRTFDGAGHPISAPAVERMLADACEITRAAADPDAALVACARRLGVYDLTRLQPANHFWTLQAGELAIFLAVAMTLVAGCFWRMRRLAA